MLQLYIVFRALNLAGNNTCRYEADHLTFDGGGGGMGDSEKNISCRLISRGKKILQGNTWRKKYLSWRIMLGKNLHRCMSGKRILSPEG